MVAFYTIIIVLLTVFSPVLAGIWLHRRFVVPWRIFLLGALVFILSQVVHIPLNHLLEDWGVMARQGALTGPVLWRTALVGGLTAGLCEELARLVSFIFMKKRKIEDGLMLGIGHGGIESMVFGGVLTAAAAGALLDLRGVDIQTLEMTQTQLQILELQMDVFLNQPWTLIFTWVERVIAMFLHVSLSILVWKAVVERKPALVLLAVAYHMAVDAVVIVVANSGWVHYQANLAFLLVSLPLVFWALRNWLQQKPAVGIFHKSSAPVFIAAFRKEILGQIRTKRFLIVLSIFAGFGILSPLLARFMPEIIGSIEEARDFAHLIPVPTAADSYGQYIKNLSQFGFILVLLLGMGAVAGEQEHGTAAMILSKPMPRWIFVFSKLLAQALVYFTGLLTSAVFTFGYTWILFGPQDAGPFILINLLLFLWLLTYAGVTLAGSTLGRTSAAAAGFGMGGMVLLLVMGSIPMLGQLAPGGLIAWANQLAWSGTGSMNPGAAAMALVLIVMSMLGSIAVMEKKEI